MVSSSLDLPGLYYPRSCVCHSGFDLITDEAGLDLVEFTSPGAETECSSCTCTGRGKLV